MQCECELKVPETTPSATEMLRSPRPRACAALHLRVQLDGAPRNGHRTRPVWARPLVAEGLDILLGINDGGRLLRKDVEGWGVPAFKQEAAKIYTDVGAALANADVKTLKKLTTPSCFATMKASLRERPTGSATQWDVRSCIAKVVQVRIGHHASNPGRRFAQVTCEIEASLVWSIFDRKGAIVGGVGSKAQPFEEKGVWWVFERCISQPPEPPAWRLKEQIRAPPPAPE